MNAMRFVCLLAGAMATAPVMAQASSIEGTWEGTWRGVKAVTLTLAGTSGRVGGEAVFYIIRDEGSGTHNGAALPPVALRSVRWIGGVLRFSVRGSEGQAVEMELKWTGDDTATLTRQPNGREPAMTIRLRRLWRPV